MEQSKEQLAVTEGSKLIAEFMGWKEMSHTKSKNWMLSELIDGELCAKKECSLAQMKFHTSWDWLMPVVEKIESLGFQFHIKNEGAAIKKWWFRGNVPDLGSVQETKIAATWEICIRFILWYNNQKTSINE